jgi:predicted MFS family arabinose efflux permease
MFGIGTSLTFYPAVFSPAQWFARRRGLATGAAMAGSGLGGMAVAPITRALIRELGVSWALRCLSGGVLVFLSTAILLLRPGPTVEVDEKKEEEQKKHEAQANNTDQISKIEAGSASNDAAPSKTDQAAGPRAGSLPWVISLIKRPAFFGIWATNIFGSLGYLVPFHYISAYAVYHSLSPEEGAALISMMNGASAVGRIVLGLVSDRLGQVNTYIMSMCSGGLMCLIIWLPSTGMAPLSIFSLLYGFYMGGFVALTPLVISVSFGLERVTTIAGMIYASTGVSNLIGSPIAGAILDSSKEEMGYMGVIIYAGLVIVTGSSMATLIVRRSLTKRWRVRI